MFLGKTLSVPLPTQVYKWVLTNLMLGVTLQWTSIPSRGGGGEGEILLDASCHENQAPVVQKVDNAIHRINYYPVDSVVCFVITYSLDSDLSGG